MRRPPDPQLLGFLTAYDRPIADLALALREIILEEAPDASESIYQVYTDTGSATAAPSPPCTITLTRIGSRANAHWQPLRGAVKPDTQQPIYSVPSLKRSLSERSPSIRDINFLMGSPWAADSV